MQRRSIADQSLPSSRNVRGPSCVPVPTAEVSSRDRFAFTGEDVAVARDAAQRRPTAHEHQMTDQPNSTDDEMPAGDPELAALVRPNTPADDADASTPAGDPELAALVRHNEPPFDVDTALFPVAAVTEDEPPARP